MSIRIRCICTWEGNINDSLAGKKVRCPDCRGAIQVPPAPPMPEQPGPAAVVRAVAPVPPAPVPPAPAPVFPPPAPPAPARISPPPAPLQARSPAAPSKPATPPAPPAVVAPVKNAPAPKPDPFFDAWDAEIVSEDDSSGFDDPFSAPPTSRNAARKKSAPQHPLNPWEPPGTADASHSARAKILQGANPFSRLVARILEGFISLLALLPGIALLSIGGAQVEEGGGQGPAVVFTGLGLLLAAGISLTVFQIILCCQGKSIGKKLMGLTVYDAASGLPAGFIKTFGRELLPNLVSFCVPVIGGLAALVDLCFIFSSDHRRLVDKICDTVVVAD
ncbi:MAG: RDD family protein [Planctomycetota bacterium]